MKKFFALFLMVALLAVAGSAFAADPDTTGHYPYFPPSNPGSNTNSAAVTVTQGSVTTVTLSAIAGTGSYTYAKVEGPAWVTVSGDTVMIAPLADVAARDYTAIFSATDSNGVTLTANNLTINITVTEKKTGGETGSGAVTLITVTVVVKEEATASNVPVISASIAAMPTLEEQSTITPAVETAIQNTINIIRTLLNTVLEALGLSVPQSAPVMPGNNMQAAKTDNYKPNDAAGNLARGAARLQNALGSGNTDSGRVVRAAGVPEPFKAEKSGMQPMSMPKLDNAFIGHRPRMWMGASRPTTPSFIASAVEDANQSIFLDSAGNSVDVVPEDGLLTAIVYVEEGELYEPVLAVEMSSASADTFDNVAGTNISNDIAFTNYIKQEKQVRATSGFNPEVDVNDMDEVSALLNVSLDMLPASVISNYTTTTLTQDEQSFMAQPVNGVASTDLAALAIAPTMSLDTFSSDKVYTYIMKLTLNAPSLNGIVSSDAFRLYPRTINGNGDTNLKLFARLDTGMADVTNMASEVLSDLTVSVDTWLVFTLSPDGTVRASAWEMDSADLRPSVVVVRKQTGENPNTPTTTKFGLSVSPNNKEGKVGEEVTFNFTITASNASGDVKNVNMTLADKPDWLTFTHADGATTATVTGTHTFNEPYEKTFTVTATDNVRTADNTATATFTISITRGGDPSGPGDSGGCDAGFAALALAVLGSFIATRKK